jgi:hypothetical protein
MNKSDLSPYQRKVYKNYQDILEELGLNADSFIDSLDETDKAAIIPSLKNMMDQVIRSEIILDYTLIDQELDSIIIRHFFRTGQKLVRTNKTKKYKTLEKLLENIYPIKKLEIIQSFKKVPREVINIIHAINGLRNGMAHSFFLGKLKAVNKTYKHKDLTKVAALREFRADVSKLIYFFYPNLK